MWQSGTRDGKTSFALVSFGTLGLPVDVPCSRSNHYETARRWIHTAGSQFNLQSRSVQLCRMGVAIGLLVAEGPGSSLRFKFFYHSILWEGDEAPQGKTLLVPSKDISKQSRLTSSPLRQESGFLCK